MLHNLLPSPDSVYMTWEIDFVPATSPAAATLKPVSMQWMDVAGISAYPVFDAKRSFGRSGRYTFPDQARGAQKSRVGDAARQWTVPSDLTLVQTAGHLHPGGLYTDLKVTRGGVTKPLFRSEADYFEPAGAVSWDVAMTATKPSWRVRLKQGDVRLGLGDLRHLQGVLVRVDGHHGPRGLPRSERGRDRPVRRSDRDARHTDPRPPDGERPPRRR